jgi:hypothetical protein
MSRWNEDNFLEEIMPLLRRIADGNPCPHTGASRSFAGGEASKSLETALVSHASECPACKDLQERLQRFDDPTVVGPQTEWEQTEKRLYNWLQSFLASDAAVHQADDRKGQSRFRSYWQSLTKPFLARQMRWVLVPVAALALLIGAFLAGRVSVHPSERMIAKTKPFNERAQSAAPQWIGPEGGLSARSPQGAQQSSQALSPAVHHPIEQSQSASIAAKQRRPAATPLTAPHRVEAVTETAAIRPPLPIDSGKPLTAPIPATPPSLAPSAAGSQAAPDNRAFQTARASGSVISVRPTRSGTALLGPTRSPTGMLASRALSAGAPAPEASVAHPAAIPLPPQIRLDAGTRVWITLKSIYPRADGVSEFQGVVLLPVTQSGAVLLGRNAEVSGTMAVRNGKRSVQIMGFLWMGTHYRLRGANGNANLRLLGAGEVVEFDAGRVLETWMESESTYEKLSGEGNAPVK